MQWRERRKWQRFDVLQEGVSACALLDKQGRSTHMLIHDIGMGGLRLVQPEDESMPKAASGAFFILAGSHVPRFGGHLDGRRVRMVWTNHRTCGFRFDFPLFGQPSGLRRFLGKSAIPSRVEHTESLLVRLAIRLGWR